MVFPTFRIFNLYGDRVVFSSSDDSSCHVSKKMSNIWSNIELNKVIKENQCQSHWFFMLQCILSESQLLNNFSTFFQKSQSNDAVTNQSDKNKKYISQIRTRWSIFLTNQNKQIENLFSLQFEFSRQNSYQWLECKKLVVQKAHYNSKLHNLKLNVRWHSQWYAMASWSIGWWGMPNSCISKENKVKASGNVT